MRPVDRILAGLLCLAITSAACGHTKDVIPTTATEADKFLYERGTEMLNKRKWLNAREYFRQIVDNYPQSPYRPDAKLGLGDTYLGEGTTESMILAQNEFREFLTFFPTHRRADYAQYKLGLTHYRGMRSPDRDQTDTKAAITEWTTFVERHPNSPLIGEVRTKLREVKDRLSESEFRVGLFYYRAKWYPATVDRLKTILKNDPDFTKRDEVYYYLGESYLKVNSKAEALPYFERLIKEFERSEYLEKAQKRIAELKSETAEKKAR